MDASGTLTNAHQSQTILPAATATSGYSGQNRSSSTMWINSGAPADPAVAGSFEVPPKGTFDSTIFPGAVGQDLNAYGEADARYTLKHD